MDCCSPDDPAFDREFDALRAAADLAAYRRRGPAALTRQMIEGLVSGDMAEAELASATVLDIGAGVGAVHLELLRAGVARAIDVDASAAYLAAAREEAARQGRADRVTYVRGDFVAHVAEVPPADFVALDRVICCYADVTALVSRSAALTRRRYALIYPKDTLLARVAVRLENAWERLRGRAFRGFVHRTAEVEALVAAQGLVPRLRRSTLAWQLTVFERPAAPTASG
jgi:magnesium-protoporphyrin O-methyltransferase